MTRWLTLKILRRLRENRRSPDPLRVRRSRFCVAGGALRYRLRNHDHRAGVVPLFALSGIEGRLFAPLASLHHLDPGQPLVSITLTPVMAYYLLPQLKGCPNTKAVNTLSEARYRRLEQLPPPAHAAAAATALVLMAARAFLLPRAFLPPFNEGTFTTTCCSIRRHPRNRPRRLDRRTADPRCAGSQNTWAAHRRAELDDTPKASTTARSL